jgi:molybdate transport system regulatory protein
MFGDCTHENDRPVALSSKRQRAASDGRTLALVPRFANAPVRGSETTMITVRVFLRLSPDTRIGLGKIQLLEAIETAGSISAAARALKMSFRRAWELLDHMNKAFGRPVVTGHPGSTGGAELTALGRDVVRRYRDIEAETQALAAPHLAALDACRLAERDDNEAG